MDPISIIIFILILLFSVIFHEVAHGLVAEKLGDPTAREAGRLTLNPIPHIDPFGSILLPLFLFWATHGMFVFGAAKPVPVDYRNFKNLKRDMFLVAIAGVATNFLLAILAAAVFRLVPNISAMGQDLLIETVSLNLVLCFFNLIPVPPLDGSKVLASILGYFNEAWMYAILSLERFGIWLFAVLAILLYTGVLQSIVLPPLVFFLKFLLGPNAPLGF
ncbi:MAG: site-2 protease family protein [Candidatus Doudnabacteria bacterium]